MTGQSKGKILNVNTILNLRSDGSGLIGGSKDERFTVTYDTIVLTDFEFWAQHESELDQWCQDHGVERTGMLIAPVTRATELMFELRWR